MAATKKRLGTILFNDGTTYKTDFRSFAVKDVQVTRYEPKPRCLQPRAAPLKDVHTLTAWRNDAIPFSLLHAPKQITGTSPTNVQQRFERAEDSGLDEAIKTRPRLAMTPALCMDNIEDRRVRDVLLDSMYTSSAARAQKEVETAYFSVRAPLPKLPMPAKTVTLPKLRPPQVSPEWKMESVTWDQERLRCYCPTTREFWLRRDPPRCYKCEESAAVTRLRRTQRRMVQKIYE